MARVAAHQGGPLASSADEWSALSIAKLRSAEKLIKIRERQLAYDQLGYAVECAIKALIMRKKRLNRWPDREDAAQLYVHGLNSLMKQSGLFQKFCKDRRKNQQLRHYWLVVKDWAPSRYFMVQPSAKFIEDMHTAVSDPKDGVLVWLNQQ